MDIMGKGWKEQSQKSFGESSERQKQDASTGLSGPTGLRVSEYCTTE